MAKYFATEDFAFACFLKASGIDLREVQISDPSKNKCKFVFRLAVDSDELVTLQRDWSFSTRAKEIKRVLFANKMLKKELKLFLTDYNANRPHINNINNY